MERDGRPDRRISGKISPKTSGAGDVLCACCSREETKSAKKEAMDLLLVLQLILLFAVVAVVAVVVGGGAYDERASARDAQYPKEGSSASPHRPA